MTIEQSIILTSGIMRQKTNFMTILLVLGDIRLDIPCDWSADRLRYDVIDDLKLHSL